jgi:O-antigen ligase
MNILIEVSKYSKKSILTLIISLIIPFLITGSFLPDLIISLSSLVFLGFVFKNKLFFYFTKKPLVIFFIFCIYCILVSIFVANDILLSFQSSLFYFRIGIFVCVVWYLIEKDQKLLDFFYYALIICFSVLLVDSYLQYFFGVSIAGEQLNNKGKYLLGDNNRIASLFKDDLIMGSYLSRLYPLLLALFVLKKKNKIELYSMIIFFTLVSSIIYISGERAAFFLHLISILFIIIFMKNYKQMRLIMFVGFLIIISAFTLGNNHLKKRMIKVPISSITNNAFTKNHDSIMRTAYNMFIDKPIFGHGPKMFRVLCKDGKYSTGSLPCATHPHNFYIQLLAETGIIGFGFLFSVFAFVLYCAYRQFKSMVLRQKEYLSDYQVCLLSGILITVWPITTNGNFFNNWLMIAYSLPVGFYLHSLYGKNKEEIYKNQK